MSKNVERHSGMTTGQRWFIIVAGTIAVFAIIGALTGSTTRSNVATAAQPTPVAQQAPQPTTQPEPYQQKPGQTIYLYVNNDYEVGYGEGQIMPGRYVSNGSDEFFSTWMIYSDAGKQHFIDGGSIGESQQRFMNVPQDAKVVALTGTAGWVKVG
jgi:hypothetical protein